MKEAGMGRETEEREKDTQKEGFTAHKNMRAKVWKIRERRDIRSIPVATGRRARGIQSCVF